MHIGHGHPCQRALDELERIFTGMGYEVVEGPEIEYQEYNFTKLNIPEGHPARDEQDTFYITDQILLQPDLSGTGAYHGKGQASHQDDITGKSVPL